MFCYGNVTLNFFPIEKRKSKHLIEKNQVFLMYYFKWILFLSKMWKNFSLKSYIQAYIEINKQLLYIILIHFCNAIDTSPLIFPVNQWAGSYIIATLDWKGLNETHENPTSLPRKDSGLHLSHCTHNVN